MQQHIRRNIKEAHNISDEKPIYTLIVDGNSVFKRSFTGDKRIGGDGLIYGGVYQFLNQLRKMLQKKDFDYVYVMWDGEYSGKLRYDIYPDYKKSRDKNFDEYGESDYIKRLHAFEREMLRRASHKKVKTEEEKRDKMIEEANFREQQEILQCILEELFIRQLQFELVEGDDLVATYVKNKKDNERVVIMSGDVDLTQLISESVCVYAMHEKKFITNTNSTEHLGYSHENVCLVKTICGDNSDSIVGIKGLGNTSLIKYFPVLKERRCELKEIIQEARNIQENRRSEGKKPLSVIDNLLGKETTSVAGRDVFKVNEKIINLKNPILTDEAKDGVKEMMYAPIDPEGRSCENIREIIREHKMTDLLSEENYVSFFSPFSRVIDVEKRRFKAIL